MLVVLKLFVDLPNWMTIMKQSLTVLIWFGLLVPIVGQDKPVPAHEAASKFTLPEGFTATLFAGEPHIVQPFAINSMM